MQQENKFVNKYNNKKTILVKLKFYANKIYIAYKCLSYLFGLKQNIINYLIHLNF